MELNNVDFGVILSSESEDADSRKLLHLLERTNGCLRANGGEFRAQEGQLRIKVYNIAKVRGELLGEDCEAEVLRRIADLAHKMGEEVK